MSKQIKPGEWQTEVNQWGGTRRFRMVGNTKEYETQVITSHGTFSQSQIDKGIRVKTRTIKQEKEERYCPFKAGNRVLCRKDCAFWSEAGCMQSSDTAGKKCPLSLYPCDDKCRLYDNGCLLIRKER